MTGSVDTSVSPYYDDFDEDKSFHRLLFRPARPIQARELTQLQTILQNQIARFGENIFKDGSIIVPGGISIDTQYEYVKLQDTDLSTAIVGDTLTGQTSGNTAKLLQKVDVEGSDPATFYVQYTSGGRFADGEDIVVSGTGSGTFTATVSSATGQGTKVNLSKGIFFIKGFFVAAVTQSLILEKYSTPSGTIEVGLTVSESIVTSSTDSSLLSNAAGTNNFNAPGADRLKITATLVNKADIEESNGETSEDYISLAIVQDGVIVEKFLRTQYNILGDELARRTFDESGNYTVDPFIAEISEDDADDTKLVMTLDPGKAYVRGYEIEKAISSILSLNRALDTSIQQNGKTSCYFGNYVRTSAPTHLPNIGQFQQVNLLDSVDATIGTARVRAITRESNGTIYRFYLFEVSMNSTKTFNQVRKLASGSFTTTLVDLANNAYSTNTAELYDTNRNNLLFNLPYNRVKEITDITARVQRYVTGTTNGSGAVTLDTGSSTITWEDTSSWIAIRNDTGAIVTPSYAATGSQTIVVSGLTASTAHTFIAYVDKTAAGTNARTKTLTTKTDEPLSASSPSNDIYLGEADIFEIVSVKDAADDSDITSRYILDNGQRDNFYDEGRLILKNGATPPTGDSTSDVLVTFRYFEHGASGAYFNVDSYDGLVSNPSYSYSDIPTYKLNNGTVIRLTDVFDFRPRKDDAFVDFASTGAIVNELPKTNETIQGDIEYFLPKIDLIYLDSNGSFGVVEGTPSLNPRTPSAPSTAMPIYVIEYNAGTLDEKDLRLNFIENRRYTMRDIGAIEQRVDRLEEYTTLSLLEAETTTLEVLDNSGNNRFKSGFFVDNFKSHNFSDINNFEYRASLDLVLGEARPSFIENNARLVYQTTASDGNASSNVTKKGDFLLLSYTETVELIQPYATEAINVNPYAVIVNTGSITLSPNTDEWRDVVTTTTTVTNTQNPPVSPVQNQNWNNWQTNWTGAPRNDARRNWGTFADAIRITTRQPL